MQKENVLNPVWLKATVLGSLWASSEIILGSFLHNLKIPFSGTILSGIGIIFLVAGSQNWKEKGIIWRAGIICALMKTISPSANIFGPMISIAAEAFLLEASIRILGKNWAGYLIGGGLAVSWSLFYKIIGLILVYGPNIIELYSSLYKFSIKYLNFPNLSPWSLILLLFILFLIFGALASIIGIRIGKSSNKFSFNESDDTSSSKIDYNLAPKNLKQNFSIPWLFFHFIVIVLGLILLDAFPLWIPAVYVLLYVILCIFLYKQNLNRLKNVKFWVTLIIIMILSGLLLSEFKTGGKSNYIYGFLIGLEMNLRALLMIFGFSSISIELRNPKIENWFKKKGMGQLSIALEAAFKILPFMVANLSEEKKYLRKPLGIILRLIGKTDLWLERIQNQINNNPIVFFITGKKGSGKTTFITEVISNLQKEGFKAGGILAPGYWDNNIRSRFDIVDISANERKLLCGMEIENGAEEIGRFKFVGEGLALGSEALSYENVFDKDLVVIDEVGPLELKGKGWAESINELISKCNKILILVVRDDAVEEVKNYFKLEQVKYINIENVSVDETVSLISEACKQEINLAVSI